MPSPAFESVTVSGVVDATHPDAVRDAAGVVAAMRRLVTRRGDDSYVTLQADGAFVLRGRVRAADAPTVERLLRRQLSPLLARAVEVRWDAAGVDKGFWIGAGATSATLRAAISTLERATALLARPCVAESVRGLQVTLDPGDEPDSGPEMLAGGAALTAALQRALSRQLGMVSTGANSDLVH